MSRRMVSIFFLVVILVGINSARVVNAQKKIAQVDTTTPVVSSGQRVMCTSSGTLYYADDGGIWMGQQRMGNNFEWTKIAKNNE